MAAAVLQPEGEPIDYDALDSLMLKLHTFTSDARACSSNELGNEVHGPLPLSTVTSLRSINPSQVPVTIASQKQLNNFWKERAEHLPNGTRQQEERRRARLAHHQLSGAAFLL